MVCPLESGGVSHISHAKSILDWVFPSDTVFKNVQAVHVHTTWPVGVEGGALVGAVSVFPDNVFF